MNAHYSTEAASLLYNELMAVDTPFVALAVGIPGSGKTTTLAQVAESLGITRASPDDIRKEISGDAGNQTVSSQAWAEAHSRTQQALVNGDSIILDAIHTESAYRIEEADQYRKWGAATIVAVTFDVPLEVANQRNSLRTPEYRVPEEFINRACVSLRADPPKTSEGFDKIISLPL